MIGDILLQTVPKHALCSKHESTSTSLFPIGSLLLSQEIYILECLSKQQKHKIHLGLTEGHEQRSLSDTRGDNPQRG